MNLTTLHQKLTQLTEIKNIENSLFKTEKMYVERVSRDSYIKAVVNLNKRIEKLNCLILLGGKDEGSVLSELPKEIIFKILTIKSDFKQTSLSFEEFSQKYLTAFTRTTIDQTGLINKYHVPVEISMSTKFAALEIKMPTGLNDNEIANILKIAYNYTRQQYKAHSYNRTLLTQLSNDLDSLKRQGIEFKVLAASCDKTAKLVLFK